MSQEIEALSELARFSAPFRDNAAVLDWKRAGKKVVAFQCTYVPEEIIYAAGALPVRLVGDLSLSNYDDANSYLYHNTCSFIRNCLELVLKDRYHFLDGFVAGATCDCSRRLADVWEYYHFTPFVCTLGVPRKISSTAYDLYEIELRRLRDRLEEFTGNRISPEVLIESIRIFNRRREIIRELYRMTREDNPPVSGSELMTVLNASVSLPPEMFNRIAGRLVEQVQRSQRKMEGKFRILVGGSPLNSPDFIRTIEKMGGQVVIDELCTGVRYWWEGVEDDADPLKALGRRYLHNFACPRMEPSEDRFQRILKLVRDFRVDAVITRMIPYCVPQTMEQPMVRQLLEARNIPVLELDMEYGGGTSGQVATRLQAFFEMLQGRISR